MKTKPSLKNILDVTFFVILIIFCVLVYSIYNRAQQVTQHRLLVNNVNSVNDVLEKVLSNSVAMETGTRGYTITGEEDYLSVYKQGRTDVKLWLDSLDELIKIKSVPLKDLPKLERFVASRDSLSVVVIKARKEIGMDEAVRIIKTGKGKRIMDSIRFSVMENQKEALKVLKANLKYTEDNVYARNVNFSILAGVMLLVTIFAYIRIRKMTKLLLNDQIFQKNLVDELTVQNKQVNEFASITTHNLRSPAANITALVSTVDETTTLAEFQANFEMLRSISDNLNDSLEQLMEVLSIRRNTLVEMQTMRLQGIFDKTIGSLQGQIKKADAVVTGNFEKAPELKYSRGYLESIFHNLIGNALKYRKPDVPAHVEIWSEISGHHLLLHVRDNGIGIDLNRYGHKMFGMNQKFTNHPESKGVGLFMTKAQIESMNGKITVESEPGIGTTFTVFFEL